MIKREGELLQRFDKLNSIRDGGIDPYPNDFRVRESCHELKVKYADKADIDIASDGEEVIIAGRMVAVRNFGKAAFVVMQDASGRIQVYLKKDIVGEAAYRLFKNCDVGDFIGVKGRMFRTRTKELTVEAAKFRLLSKSLRPLPEKWHGLRDVEARYRQRYLDLIMNEDARNVFLKRIKIVSLIRDFLNSRGFLEVETPMMQAVPGGAAARPFVTHHNALDIDLYLRIAPELYLKRLIIGGMERVYEINRNFRNEGISTRHNPEFTMLEFYMAYADFEDLINLTEEMIVTIAKETSGSLDLEWQGNCINLEPPWKRVRFKDAILEYGNADEGIFSQHTEALSYARSLGIDIPEAFSHGKVLTEIFDHIAEPRLIQPTFVTHYPVDVSPLSRRNEDDPSIVDRFELFVNGKELANAFSELNDPVDQRERLVQQIQERDAGDTEAHQMDEDFITAMEYGMPPTAGEGIGIDRLVMLLTGAASIRDVIFFPQLRSVSGEK